MTISVSICTYAISSEIHILRNFIFICIFSYIKCTWHFLLKTEIIIFINSLFQSSENNLELFSRFGGNISKSK